MGLESLSLSGEEYSKVGWKGSRWCRGRVKPGVHSAYIAFSVASVFQGIILFLAQRLFSTGNTFSGPNYLDLVWGEFFGSKGIELL